MKAIIQETTGGPDILHIRDIPEPELRPDDVLIKVQSSGVCYHDVVVRQGVFRKRVHLPLVPGHEVSGTITKTGSLTHRLKVGDRVCTVQRRYVCGQCEYCRSGRETLCQQQEFMGDANLNGGYAEYVAVNESCVAKVPNAVALPDAAIAACAIGVQLNAIRDVAQAQIGDSILITGANGGQGAHGIQVAKAAGTYVIAVTSNQTRADTLTSLGADKVVVVPHGEDFSNLVREANGGEGVDIVIENVGSECFHYSRKSLKQGGRMVLVGAISGSKIPFNPAQLFVNGISLLSAVSCTRVQLELTLKLMERGQVRPLIADTLDLEDAAIAHHRLESESIGGRLILQPPTS